MRHTAVASENSRVSSVIRQGTVKIDFSLCGITDAGSLCKQNQDTFFITTCGSHIALGVLDGHGRELGQLASNTARKFFLSHFKEPKFFEMIEENPEVVIRKMYSECHLAIKQAFRSHYERDGYSVQVVQPGDYLVKRGQTTQPYTCVHGGSTATIMVILHGKRMIVANVGDSTALLGGLPVEISQLTFLTAHGPAPASHYPLPPINNQDEGKLRKAEIHPEVVDPASLMQDPILLSTDHSPESCSEFRRIRDLRPSFFDPSSPELLFVYDSPTMSKFDRDSIYTINRNGEVCVTALGKYYKNVRNEWASLVTTPPHARFQDALAFTRSLGDFHLHSYGVSCEPDIVEVNLETLLAQHDAADKPDQHMVILVATDGIWDNWRYEELSEYLLETRRIRKSREEHGVQCVVKELLEQNAAYAQEHFGNQADNMTAIVCYINAIAL